MKPGEIRSIGSALSASVGRTWPLVVLRALRTKKALLGQSRWSRTRGPESQFVKRIALAPALYAELEERIGQDKAFQAVEQMLIPIGCAEQWDHLRAIDVTGKAPMERLRTFNERMDRKGSPRFNRREVLRQDDQICHFIITRCVFSDFFTAVGTPELTGLFCEVDRQFFPEAFPGLRFHRGGSWQNTIACGRDHCEFVFEKKGIQG
jgi:hypothetical protein